jgi:uncharacterized protein YhfF
MKHLSLILVLLLFSCKTEPKKEFETKDGIDQSVFKLWDDYTQVHPEFKNDELPESWYFHNNKEDADRLAELTVSGKKQASSSLYSLYTIYEMDVPTVGTKRIITNFEGKAMAIIEIKSVAIVPFNEITAEYAALDMGTDITPLEKWKKAHWDFFEEFSKVSGVRPTENMLIFCEKFETVWTTK